MLNGAEYQIQRTLPVAVSHIHVFASDYLGLRADQTKESLMRHCVVA